MALRMGLPFLLAFFYGVSVGKAIPPKTSTTTLAALMSIVASVEVKQASLFRLENSGGSPEIDRIYVQPSGDVMMPSLAGTSVKDRGGDLGDARAFTNATSSTSASLVCGSFHYSPTEKCPGECPFFAEHPSDVCYFRCVKKEECGTLIPEKAVADEEQHVCRACRLAGCKKCQSGHDEVCLECAWGYGMKDGKCDFLLGKYATLGLTGVVGVVFLFVTIWYIELRLRPTTNGLNLAHAETWLSQTRLRQPQAPDVGRALWPLSTNLCRDPIAGPGTVVFFGFQSVVILWAFSLTAGFFITALVSDEYLLILGTRPVSNEVDMCEIVSSGHAHQLEAMTGKVAFCLFAYAFTFGGCVMYAIWSAFRFQSLDDEETQKDFVAYCYDLPIMSGSQNVEDSFKDFFQSKSQQQVVGVSVCWQFHHVSEEVDSAVENDLEQLESTRPAWQKLMAPAAVTGGPRFLKGVLGIVDRLLLKMVQKEVNKMTDNEIGKMLQGLHTSGCAFVVFETESARDQAVKYFQDNPTCYEGCDRPVRLEVTESEPSSVVWNQFRENGQSHGRITSHLAMGSIFILAFICLWTLVFYLPYAYYTHAEIVASGGNTEATGPRVSYYFFTVLVSVGQAILFTLCSEIAADAGFTNQDGIMTAYVVMYAVASFITIGLDVVVTGFLYYDALKISNVHTADGRLMSELSNFQEILESFPMQRQMGDMLWGYNWTGCFLLGFIIEPILLILVMGHVARHLVRTHPELQGRKAEWQMQDFLPMDLGRYADIVINAILSSLCLLFAPGFTYYQFGAVACSHVYIYLYEHTRVLRATPAFCYSSISTDRVAQALMSIPCAIMLCAFRYKLQFVYNPSANDPTLWFQMGFLFVFQVTVQSVLALKVIPAACQRTGHEMAKCTYQEVARESPDTWFTTNPIHCLRSKHIFKHSPFCRYHFIGKEHLQMANPKACAFFQDTYTDAEYAKALEGVEAVEVSVLESVPPAEAAAAAASAPSIAESSEVTGTRPDEGGPPSGGDADDSRRNLMG